MIIGYLDNKGKNISVEEQKSIIENYAKIHNFMINIYLKSDKISSVLSYVCPKNNLIIVANAFSIGVSLSDIKDNVSLLNDNQISVHLVEEAQCINTGNSAKEFIKTLDIANKIRSSIVSIASKVGIKRRLAQGLKTGRPIGTKNQYRQEELGVK